MKNDCVKWREMMLETALSGNAPEVLRQHLSGCEECRAEFSALRLRREQMDALLPLASGKAEVPAGFRARVLSAVTAADERGGGRVWLPWAAGLATVAALLIGVALQRRGERPVPQGELVVAEKLAEWRAPSDLLLETPGREMLRTTPRLGESYLKIAVSKDQEKSR